MHVFFKLQNRFIDMTKFLLAVNQELLMLILCLTKSPEELIKINVVK